MTTEKHTEFFNSVPDILNKLKSTDKPLFGKMNATEMVIHILAGTIMFMSKNVTVLETPEELLPKYKAFLMSDRNFRPGAQKPKDYENQDAYHLACA